MSICIGFNLLLHFSYLILYDIKLCFGLWVANLNHLFLSFAMFITDNIVELFKQSFGQSHVILILSVLSGFFGEWNLFENLFWLLDLLFGRASVQNIKPIDAHSFPFVEGVLFGVAPLLHHSLSDLGLHLILLDHLAHNKNK